MSVRRTRLAPSPTGALHLGNARTFLVNWLLARQNGWELLLRIEDLDGPRVKRGAAAAAMDDLLWMGIDWDGEPVYQSNRHAIYAAAIGRLLQGGHAYPCVCTRSEVASAASAPHATDGASVYPGTCRGRFASPDDARRAAGPGRPVAIRFAVLPGPMAFDDAFAGRVEFENAAAMLGDFVIGKADWPADDDAPTYSAAYQLAVVVDDHAAGITDVIRGDDLLDSVPRQQLLYAALGSPGNVPRYAHLPLVLGPDGRRLAKRHGDSRLAHYRSRGVPASAVLRLLAGWCGVELGTDERCETAGDLLRTFDFARVPREPIIFDPAAERRLLDAAE